MSQNPFTCKLVFGTVLENSQFIKYSYSFPPVALRKGNNIFSKCSFLNCTKVRFLPNITANKGSGSDGIPAELFQMLKDGVVEVLH